MSLQEGEGRLVQSVVENQNLVQQIEGLHYSFVCSVSPLSAVPPSHTSWPLPCIYCCQYTWFSHCAIIDLNSTIDALSKTGEEANLLLSQKGALVEQQERELNKLNLSLQEASAKVRVLKTSM